MDQYNALTTQGDGAPRSQFLRILCILSFVMCGIWIIVFLFGWLMCLNLNSDSITAVWQTIVSNEPRVAGIDPVLFMGEVQKVCLYFLLANIASLVGVMMMWRVNRIGFFVYIVAELVTNFFSIDIEIPNEQKSYLGLIFYLIIDIAFIVLYAMALKPFKKGS